MIKPCLLLLLAVLSAGTTLSAQLPDSCAASPLVRQHYLHSAKIIALRQMLGDSAWADSVYIPAILYNPVLQALSAVHNATQYPERDTVTDCFDVQALPVPIYPWGILLVSDTTNVWAKRLYQGIFPTGNPTVDDLVVRYHLELSGSSQFNTFLFFFDTQEPLNTIALAQLFQDIPGTYAEANASFGSGNNITLDTVASGVTLTYHVGWGDCPAGCIFERDWIFLVRADCSVQFLGATGDPLTAEVSCTSSFTCATNPLCLPWLQDSLRRYAIQYPDCQTAAPRIHATLYQKFSSDPVIGIHIFIGIDAASTYFFNCNGDYIGSCSVTIAGFACMPADVSEYLEGDTIWDCSQPLPTPANCGLTAAAVLTTNIFSFQLAPNPVSATGQVMVKADFGTRSRGRLVVLDVLGKMVLQKTFDADQLTEPVNLLGHSPGLYFVRLEVAGQSFTRKLLLLAP